MRLDQLAIKSFKNLQDFWIDFNEKSQYTILIGQNGSGKSNLIEAIVLIFKHLDLDRKGPFTYWIKYRCRGYRIEVKCKEDEYPTCEVDGAEKSRADFLAGSKETDDGRSPYLPRFVFGYYSGPSNRLEEHFKQHQINFFNELIAKKPKSPKLLLRPLFYVQPVHGQFALLSFFGNKDPQALELLRKELGIERLLSVLFVIRQAEWGLGNKTDRFWGARAHVRGLLDAIFDIALAPMRTVRQISTGLKNKQKRGFWYLFLDLQGKTSELLVKLAKGYGRPQEFFKILESTYINELLHEVRPVVKIRNVDGRISYRELSEGEQQLLMVLGLMRFTQEDESLFLLDEPDTHLNPVWAIQYLNLIEQLVGKLEKSHLVMATHNPLLFSGLDKTQVRIMQAEQVEREGKIVYQVIAKEPDENPRGMGVAAILTSDLFGLRSTLDLDTQKLWEERRTLASKRGRLTEKDRTRLNELETKLPRLSLKHPLFDRFIEAWEKQEGKAPWTEEPGLNAAELEEARNRALTIVRDLVQKAGAV